MRWMTVAAMLGLLGLGLLAVPSIARAQDAAYGTAATELAEQISRAFPKVTGRVIGLEQERVLLDLGKKDQVIPGLELQVYRSGQEFKHPFTGQPLGKLDRDVGRVRILEVHDAFSVAEVIQQVEGTVAQQGDQVRVTSARVILALPNVDVADVAGANTRSVTRDLVNALVKTGRFEVMVDQRIRAAAAEEKIQLGDQLTEPAVLQALWKRLRVSAVLLAKLSLQEKGVQWDVQLISTVRGDSITLASAEVKGVAPRAASVARSGGGSANAQGAPRIDQIALRSQELPYRGQAMAAGNLTGDGTTKLVITDGQGVYVYDLEKSGVKLLWSTAGVPRDNILSVDVADINQNGTDEIFVTNYSENRVRSYVLEWKGGKFVRISEELPLHLRVLDTKAGRQLYGQAAGDNKPFDGAVRRYGWQGNRYTPGETVVLPKAFNVLYNFMLADLDGDGAPEVVVLDGNDYLRVFDRGGTELYRTSDRFGGSERFVETDPARGQTTRTGIEPERLVLQSRIFFQDVLGDGKRQVLVPRNTPSTGYVFRTRLYDKGRLFGLGWDGLGMQSLWETRDMPGYIADFALIGSQDAIPEWKIAILVVQTNVLGMSKSRSSVVLLELRPPA